MFNGTLRAVTNNTDWILSFRIRSKSNADLVNLANIQWNVAIYKQGCSPVLTGSSTGGEITAPDIGILKIQFLAPRMGVLRGGTYCVEIKAARNGFTSPVALFSLPVIEGKA